MTELLGLYRLLVVQSFIFEVLRATQPIATDMSVLSYMCNK